MNSAKKNTWNILLFCILLISWTVLFKDSLRILFENIIKPSQIIHLLLISLFLLLIAVKNINEIRCQSIKLAPLIRSYVFVAMIFLILFHYLNNEFLYVNILSVIMFIIGIFLISLMFMRVRITSSSILTLFILLFLLPVTSHLNGLFGFPLRHNIALIVEKLFSILPFDFVSHETVLIIENRVASIDIACSGMNSIWGAALAFLILSWIQSIRISFKWIASFVLFLFLILTGNIIRTTVLVFLYTVLNAKELADAIHFPLGILIFIIPLLVTFYLFQFTAFFCNCKNSKRVIDYKRSPIYSIILLIVVFIGILFVKSPQVNSHFLTFKDIKETSEILLERLPLTEGEKKLYTTYPVKSYSKYRFKYNNVEGSFLLVETNSWKAHHNPKDCIQGNGFKIDSLETKFIDENRSLSFTTLNDEQYSSCFWFQSGKTVTDDFSKRIWKHFTSTEKHWILVSVLFDKSIDLYNKQNLHFVHWLIGNVSQTLAKD